MDIARAVNVLSANGRASAFACTMPAHGARSRARSARAASDAVRQPVLERLIRESALPPRCKVLLAQPELAQDVRVSALVQAAHGDRSYAAGESDAVGWDR